MSALQRRYAVTKINDPDGKHKNCRYFVLDPQHDLAAREALLEYARRSGGDLATELVEWVLEIEKAQKESNDE